MTKRPAVLGLPFRRNGGQLDGLGQTRPLAQVTGGVEVRHPRRVVRIGGAFLVAQIEETVLLIEVGLVEEKEQLPQDVVVARTLVVRDPAVAQPLENQRDAVHLAVGAGRAAERPAETVGAHQVGHHPNVLLGVGAQRRQLPVAHAAVGVELQGGADEDKRHHSVQVEVSAQSAGGIVEKSGRTGVVDPIDHALDQARGFVLL
jgi:hypothetical protein